MNKVKFIYNPNSGDKSITNKLDIVISTYQDNDFLVVPFRLDKKNDIEDSLKDLDDTYHHILISGGDGSIDSLINAMKNNDIDLPVGILPLGTANDFAKALDLECDVKLGIEKIINSVPKKIDIGKINNKYFINVASCGMFTDVSQKINTELKNYMGRASYYIVGIEQALNFRKYNIEVSSDEINYKGDMYLMLIFNGKTAGNMNIAYKSSLDDGLLDVVIFKAMPIPKSISLLIRVLRSEHLEGFNENEILYFKTKKLHLECSDELTTDIDGEKGPDFPLDIECIDGGISILGVN
ncbi:MAG: YegS/Rv2252/BmrU family lipid kinase [Peptostreptococcaceae bacterium]